MHARADAQALRRLVDLLELVDGRGGHGEAVLEEHRDLVAEDPAHHEDGQGEPGLPQGDRLLEERDAERARPEAGQVPGHRHEPVAVGVGLHDGHHRGRGHRRLDRAEVLRETIQADLDDRRPQRALIHAYLGTTDLNLGMTSLARSSIEWRHACGF